jgi:hypothetical protein
MKKDCRVVVNVVGWHQNRVACGTGDPSFCLRYRESKKKPCKNMDDQTGLIFCQDSSGLGISVETKTVRPWN